MTPQELQQAVQAAMAAVNAGQMDDAVARAKAILGVFPGEPNASQILGMTLLQQNLADEAIPHLHNAKRAAPDHPQILNMLGVAHKQKDQREEARVLFARVTKLAPKFVDAWLNLGQLDLDDGRLDQARDAFEKALKLQPGNAKGLAGRARVALLSHDNEVAGDVAAKAIAADPDNTLARLMLIVASLRLGNLETAKDAAQAVLTRDDVSPINRAYAIGFAGDAEERLGNFDNAFAAYTQANDIQAGVHKGLHDLPLTPFHPEVISKLTEVVKGDAPGPTPACPDAEPMPVFLVGFPRSGTTLLEQVLLAHPKILSMGEQATVAKAVGDLVLDETGLARLGHLTSDEAADYRSAYWEHVAELGAAPAPDDTYLDKLPLNTVLLPVIAKIFPRAKILFAIRDPRDVVMSCFQQRFGMNQAMYQFLNLETAASYYDQIMSLGLAAREAENFDLHEIRYESVVANLEGEARAALYFLGLEWDPTVLDYRTGARNRSINTPSVAQVVQPIYTTAKGKWHNYESHLAPVRGILDPWADHWGYPKA